MSRHVQKWSPNSARAEPGKRDGQSLSELQGSAWALGLWGSCPSLTASSRVPHPFVKYHHILPTPSLKFGHVPDHMLLTLPLDLAIPRECCPRRGEMGPDLDRFESRELTGLPSPFHILKSMSVLRYTYQDFARQQYFSLLIPP